MFYTNLISLAFIIDEHYIAMNTFRIWSYVNILVFIFRLSTTLFLIFLWLFIFHIV